MAVLHIMIPNADSVNEFVELTGEFNFDMDLCDGNRCVDAKSILGILYLGVGKVHKLSVPEERVKFVEDKLSTFVVSE
nr:HPr family phosphocarrier protein [uncultured Oribacterium sp.]